jgi:hypothetical protein
MVHLHILVDHRYHRTYQRTSLAERGIPLPHAAAAIDHDLQAAVTRLEADIEASLAIARATLMALASLSPAMLRHANDALAWESEAEGRSPRAAEALRLCRDRLFEDVQKDRLSPFLEQALITAAAMAPADRQPRRA